MIPRISIRRPTRGTSSSLAAIPVVCGTMQVRGKVCPTHRTACRFRSPFPRGIRKVTYYCRTVLCSANASGTREQRRGRKLGKGLAALCPSTFVFSWPNATLRPSWRPWCAFAKARSKSRFKMSYDQQPKSKGIDRGTFFQGFRWP